MVVKRHVTQYNQVLYQTLSPHWFWQWLVICSVATTWTNDDQVLYQAMDYTKLSSCFIKFKKSFFDFVIWEICFKINFHSMSVIVHVVSGIVD